MPLILGTTPGCELNALKNLLDQAGWQTVTDQPETWYQTGLEQPDDSKKYLLVHSRPEHAVARALDDGQSPEQALQSWLIAAQAMVSFYKNHRKYSVMVFQECFITQPQAMLEALSDNINHAVQADTEWPVSEQSSQNALHTLMANQLVSQTRNIDHMLAQLEACTIPLEGIAYQAPPVDLAAVTGYLTSLRQTVEQAAEQQMADAQARDELEQKRTEQAETHNRELEQLQQEYEQRLNSSEARLSEQQAAFHKLEQDKQAIAAALSQEQQKRQAEQETHQRTEDNLKQENGLLLEQLHLVQEELEAKYQQAKSQEAELANAQRQLADGKAEQQKLRDSLNELKTLKTTNEQREKQLSDLKAQLKTLQQQKAKDDSSHQQARADVEEENQLLLEQLHLVQEELERQFNAFKRQEAELQDYRQDQDCALTAANREISRLQTELNAFKSSVAWKATAPVRAMARPFRRGNPAKKSFKKQVELVKKSGLFDEKWYLSTYPDVAEAGASPIEHYLKFGAEERRNPGPDFDTDWYLSSYPDVAEKDINPLVHYIKFGLQEGRATSRYHYPSLPAPGAEHVRQA